MNFQTKSSGQVEQMETGAQRDSQAGKLRYDLIPTLSLKRVAGLYARGAELYGDRNWEKGMKFSRLMASLERHLHQFKQGEIDEDHLSAVAWNCLALMHFQSTGRHDLNDLPLFTEKVAPDSDLEAGTL